MAESYGTLSPGVNDSLGVCGPSEDPFSGRAWVRTFPSGMVELLYRAGSGPSETEQFNAWMTDAGIDNRVARLGPPRFGGHGSVDQDTGEITKESNADRTARRAKQRVRWLVKALGADQMLTLTYRDNVTDYAEAKKHFQRFTAICRREWPRWKHVAAPERQARGAWHWHIAVKGWQNYDKLRGFWWRAMGHRVAFSEDGKPVLLDLPSGSEHTPGNVQGVSARSRGRKVRSWRADRLASYVGKYVGKAIGADGLDGAAYSASRGLTWRTERYAVRALTFGAVAGRVSDLLSAAGVCQPTFWTSPDRQILWAAGSQSEPPAPEP